MTRDQFIVEFGRRFRLVLQKHELEVLARRRVSEHRDSYTFRHELEHSNLMLDGAIADVGDLVSEMLNQKAPLSPTDA